MLYGRWALPFSVPEVLSLSTKRSGEITTGEPVAVGVALGVAVGVGVGVAVAVGVDVVEAVAVAVDNGAASPLPTDGR